MKAFIKVQKEVEVKFIRVILAVRYEEEDIPNDFPLRNGDLWKGTIEIDTGRIIEWPVGKTGDMYMKVCDQGVYELLDENKTIIAAINEGYVPNGIIPPKDGYGDYVHFKINGDGIITNWYDHPSIGQFFDKEDE